MDPGRHCHLCLVPCLGGRVFILESLLINCRVTQSLDIFRMESHEQTGYTFELLPVVLLPHSARPRARSPAGQPLAPQPLQFLHPEHIWGTWIFSCTACLFFPTVVGWYHQVSAGVTDMGVWICGGPRQLGQCQGLRRCSILANEEVGELTRHQLWPLINSPIVQLRVSG